MKRTCAMERKTNETTTEARLRLDGGARSIDVPDGFFAHMLDALTVHGGFGLELRVQGDTEVDLHHTVEDVGLVLGDAIAGCLGEKRGIVRFAHAYAPLDEALARTVIDCSGRGSLTCHLPPELEQVWVTRSFPLTLIVDFFQALVSRAGITMHLDILRARNGHHAAEAAFKSAALAFRAAFAERGDSIPSTKGTLTA